MDLVQHHLHEAHAVFHAVAAELVVPAVDEAGQELAHAQAVARVDAQHVKAALQGGLSHVAVGLGNGGQGILCEFDGGIALHIGLAVD